MRILHVTPAFSPQIGGIETVVEHLSKTLSDQGVVSDIAHVGVGNRYACDSFGSRKVWRVPLIGHRLAGFAPALRAIVHEYDLLHVHDPQLMAITANVRMFAHSKPAVLSTHGGFWHTDCYHFIKRIYESTLLRSAASHYRRVLATSVGDFEYFKHHISRIELCSNGVRVRHFNAVQPQQKKNLLQWIYWGRLSRNKRVDLIIDYVAHARRLGYSVQLLVCGQDFDKLLPELSAQVKRLGLREAVSFKPFLDDEALCVELAQRSLFISASEHEGFGLSIVEAMAAGLIVVCRNIVPISNFFTHGRSGWFLRFDGGSVDIQTLGELLSSTSDEVASMSAAARKAASVHDWDTAAARFVQQYRQVLDGKA